MLLSGAAAAARLEQHEAVTTGGPSNNLLPPTSLPSSQQRSDATACSAVDPVQPPIDFLASCFPTSTHEQLALALTEQVGSVSNTVASLLARQQQMDGGSGRVETVALHDAAAGHDAVDADMEFAIEMQRQLQAEDVSIQAGCGH